MENNVDTVDTRKSKWLMTDETCPVCGQVTKKVRGITKQNLKRLIIPKWNMTEATITLLLIALIVLGLSYGSETAASRDWLDKMSKGSLNDCLDVCGTKCQMIQGIKIIGNETNTMPYNASILK